MNSRIAILKGGIRLGWLVRDAVEILYLSSLLKHQLSLAFGI